MEYLGDWWLPEAPDERVAGTLRLTPGGRIELTCLGDFPGYKTSFSGRMAAAQKENLGVTVVPISLEPSRTPPLINGMAHSEGKWQQITLCATDYMGGSQAGFFAEHSIARFRVKIAIIGHCFESLEDTTFDAVEANFFRVRSWLGYDFLQRTVTEELKQRSVTGTFTFQALPEVDIPSLDARLSFATRVRPKRERNFRFEIKYDVPIELRPSVAQPFEWYLSAFGKLQILISLLCGNSANSISYVGLAKGERLDIYFDSTTEWVEDAYDDTATLTTLAALESEFPQLVNTWFENFERFGKAIYLYNANLKEGRMYPDLRLLSLAQAAESAHRELYGEWRWDETEMARYEDVKARLLSELVGNISPAFNDSLTERLDEVLRTPFRKRLQALYKAVAPVVRHYIPEREPFVEAVLITRNYFTHHARELESRAAEGAALIVLNIRLEVLLSATFLRELGLEQGAIEEFFRYFRKYQRIKEIERLNPP
jgi:hypothetical protein